MAGRLQDVILRGLAAARPLPADVGPGTLYFATDTNVTTRNNDTMTAWESYSGSVAGTGDVLGPASATDSDFAQFDGTTGKLLKDGLALTLAVADPGVDTNVPSEKAVRDAITAIPLPPPSGDVFGPASAVDSNFAQFDGVTGKIIKDSLLALTTTVATPGVDTLLPTEKAVRDAITAGGGGGGAGGTLIGIRVFTTPGAGTYTPTIGTDLIVLEMVGGGGAGGGVPTPGATFISFGRGGSGAAFLRKRITSGFSGASYVVGAKGTGVSAATGNNGTASTFTAGTVYTAGGGLGGNPGGAGGLFPLFGQTMAGGAATNGDLNVPGGSGYNGYSMSSSQVLGGRGGSSFYGEPTGPTAVGSADTSVVGSNANVYGAGGSGACGTGTGVARAGGDGSDGLITIYEYSGGSSTGALGITVDGGGSVITAGQKGYLNVPYACTINSATMLADVSGSAVIDVKKIDYAGFPTDVSICAAAKPTLSGAQKSQDTTLTGWTTAIAAGDILGFTVESSPATITRLHLTLKVTR